MREILFRGKRIDNDEWVYGQYAYLLNARTEDGEPIKHMIVDGTPFGQTVDPSTVGQYTGLTDKNGTRIFEGDIIATPWNDGEVRRVVHFEDGLFKAGTISLCSFTGFDSPKHNCEIIGNIHDNRAEGE